MSQCLPGPGWSFHDVVGQDIPKAHHVAPYLIGMDLSKIVGQSAAGFTQNLQMMDNPRPNQLVFVERHAAAPGILLNQLDGFEHVGQTQPVVSHRSLRCQSCRL